MKLIFATPLGRGWRSVPGQNRHVLNSLSLDFVMLKMWNPWTLKSRGEHVCTAVKILVLISKLITLYLHCVRHLLSVTLEILIQKYYLLLWSGTLLHSYIWEISFYSCLNLSFLSPWTNFVYIFFSACCIFTVINKLIKDGI